MHDPLRVQGHGTIVARELSIRRAVAICAGALGALLAFGCTITIVNDFPGEQGWGEGLAGVGGGAVGGAGGQTTSGGGTDPADCISCHGNEDNAAPPLDMNGQSDTSLLSVGSHQIHLVASNWRAPVECTECHTMAQSNICPNYEEHHCDGTIDVVFGPLANADSAATTYDTTTGTCAYNYCHGYTLEPDLSGFYSLREPIFNVVDGTYSACGTACHTNPPGDPHTTVKTCADPLCHGDVIASFDDAVAPPTVTWTDASRHIDGIVDFTPP